MSRAKRDLVRMTRSRDLDPMLVARYLSAEATPAEVALVDAWIAADSRHAAQLQELRRAWSSARPLEGIIDVDSAWHRVTASMHGADPARRGVELRLERTTKRRDDALMKPAVAAHRLKALRHAGFTRSSISVGWAASIAILLLSAGAVVYGGRSHRAGLEATNDRTTREFAAPTGQRTLIDLADGTHIILAPATHLSISMRAQGSGARDVTLDGEAIFSVTHDVARPFVVHSRYGTTMDVGTSFAVDAYPGELYRVVVRDGRVAIGPKQRATIQADTSPRMWPVLVAGDIATRRPDGTMRIAHRQNVASMFDWSNGKLTFEHTRFAELVPELERWYGIEITIASPALRERMITGQFDTESRSEALKAIGRALGARYTIDGTHVTFSSP